MQSSEPKVSEDKINFTAVSVPANHSKKPPKNQLKQLIFRLSIRQEIDLDRR